MADMRDLADFMDSYLQRNVPVVLANALAVRAAKAIVEDLALHTPADVGDALSNWQLTLDAPAVAVRPAFVPSPKGRTIKGIWTHRVPPASTIGANAPQVIAQARVVLSAKKPGQPIFITNNAEYIVLLNAGSSNQSPADFVRRAEIIGERAIEQGIALNQYIYGGGESLGI